MACVQFPHPLPTSMVQGLMDALESTGKAAIGQVTYSVDEHGVWGTDPYGCDFIAATQLDATAILASADRCHDHALRHPAEFSY